MRRVFPLPPVHDPADAPLDALDVAAAGPDDDLDRAVPPFDPAVAAFGPGAVVLSPDDDLDADRDLATGVVGSEFPSEGAADCPDDDLAAAGGPLNHPLIRSNIPPLLPAALLGPPDALREGALDSLAALSTAIGTAFATAFGATISTISFNPASTCFARALCVSTRFPDIGVPMASRNASRISLTKCPFNNSIKVGLSIFAIPYLLCIFYINPRNISLTKCNRISLLNELKQNIAFRILVHY